MICGRGLQTGFCVRACNSALLRGRGERTDFLNDKSIKKQTFLGGAAVLALSTAIVKLIGACYKIPLSIVIGDAGYGYFTTAYDIYSVLLMVATTGLPVAMSRMISEAQALEQHAQIKKIYTVSLRVFLAIGILGTGGMLLFCRQLAQFMNSPDSWYAIVALSPSLLFICVISAYRGFFQGQGNMVPTSVSQVFEALCKLFIGLGCAWIIMRKWNNVPMAAGGAILGVTCGCVVAMLYLGVCHRRADRHLTSLGGRTKTTSRTIRQLLAIAIPITLGSAGLQIINLIDAKIVMGRLLGAAGFVQADADVLKGIYNFCQTIFNLPCAFITPITIAAIPAITEHLTLKNRRGARMVEESAMRIMALLAMPCAVGLAVLSGPVLQLLRHYSGSTLTTGSLILSILGIAVIFNSLVLVTNAIMQAHGDVTTPVINMIIGGIVKIIVNYILVGSPSINIIGAPIGTVCCYAVITTLNLVAMRRHGVRPSFRRTMLKPIAASVLMGAATWLTSTLLGHVTSSGAVICLGSICVAGVVYLALVVALRVITMEDCMLLPKGEKIARILKIH